MVSTCQENLHLYCEFTLLTKKETDGRHLSPLSFFLFFLVLLILTPIVQFSLFGNLQGTMKIWQIPVVTFVLKAIFGKPKKKKIAFTQNTVANN